MTRLRLVTLLLVSSCALPKFGIISSSDDSTTTGGSKPSTGGSGESGSTSNTSGGTDTTTAGSNNQSGSGGSGALIGASGAGNDAGMPGIVDPECDGNQCTCPGSTQLCHEVCQTLNTNVHCGKCDNACTGVDECNGKDCVFCPTGCVMLSANLLKAGDQAVFGIELPPGTDLGKTRLSLRYYAKLSASVSVTFASIDANEHEFQGFITKPKGSWQELNLDTVHTSPVTDSKILLELKATDSNSDPTTIYVDYIDSDNDAVGPWKFETDADPVQFFSADDYAGTNASNTTGTVSWISN